MGKLTEDRSIQREFEKLMEAMYFEIHAIYEPDGCDLFGDCYCAAVSMFADEFTFQVYFKIKDDGSIKVEYVERWRFG